MTRSGARAKRGAVAAALDLAAALRPQLWIAPVALFEAGRTVSAASAGGPFAPLPPSAAPALASLLALLAAVHLANGWRDRASDRANRKGGALAAGRLSGRTVSLAVAGSLLAAALAAWAPPVGASTRLLLLAAGALGAAYVIPPIELKRRAGYDLAAQAAGYGIVAFALGASCDHPPSWREALASLPYAGGIATVGLLAMIADRAGDAACGQRTTAVALGPVASASLATALAAATAAGGLAFRDAAPGLWGLVAAACLTLLPPGDRASGPRGAGDEGRDAAAWIRLAVSLQILFAILLVPRTVLPLVAAVLLGGTTAFLSRRASGTNYPIDMWVRGTAGDRRERGPLRPDDRGQRSRRV